MSLCLRVLFRIFPANVLVVREPLRALSSLFWNRLTSALRALVEGNPPVLIFDCHLDLSMNALEWNRDLTRPDRRDPAVAKGNDDKRDRAKGTVCLREMRRGQIGLCVATLIAR